jgi:hypothetical protein
MSVSTEERTGGEEPYELSVVVRGDLTEAERAWVRKKLAAYAVDLEFEVYARRMRKAEGPEEGVPP